MPTAASPSQREMHLDPAFKELLFRRTGTHTLDQVLGPSADELIPVIARLVDPSKPVEGLSVIARAGWVVTGRVPLGDVARVRSHANVASLKASREVHRELWTSVPDVMGREHGSRVDLPRGRGVVIAVLDWGCDFVHANFRRSDGGTRLVAMWDQRGGPHDSSPAPFGYGREWRRADVDAALTAPDPYRALGYDPLWTDPLAQGTHGAHVLDIAAGNGAAPGAAPGVAPEADLLFVHLTGTDTAPDDTLGDSVRLLEAVRYAFDRAGDRPVVLSMSLGQHGGPHDGSTLFEQGMDALLIEKNGRAAAMSTGNYRSADVHAAGRVSSDQALDLPFDLAARDEGAAEIEIWYSGRDRLAVELLDAEGDSRARVPLGQDAIVQDKGQTLATIYHRPHDPNNGDHQIDVFLHPAAPSGRWTLRLQGDSVRDGRVHAWIERDGRATQARFAPHVASPVSTTNTICNGRHTLAVGAYDAREADRPMLPFSSLGPTRDGRDKPDLMAPGGGVLAARSSWLLDGQRVHDDLVVKSGTSMAAPHVAGAIALMFEAAGEHRLSIAETRRILLSSARTAQARDARQTGAGVVDAHAAVDATRAWVASRRPVIAPPRRTIKERPMQTQFESQPESAAEWLADGADLPSHGEQTDNAEACLDWLTGRPDQRDRSAPWEEVTYVRKSAFALSAGETDAIVHALNALSRTDLWHRYAQAHDAVAFGPRSVHGMFRQRELGTVAGSHDAYHRFLPWHRLFLLEFERAMRAQTGGARAFIPYWDWTVAAQRRLPAWLSRLPSSMIQAGSRTPFPVTRAVTVTTPPVDHDDPVLPTRASVQALMVSDRGTDPRTRAAVTTDTYDRFTAALELLHGPPHVWVGGTMAGTFSPADFVFFMHHAQIDRLWATWQRRFSAQRPSLTGSAGDLQRVDGTTVRFDTLLSVTSLGFDYDSNWR